MRGESAAVHVASALHIEHVGPQPPRFVFLHGLLGRGRNWSTVARTLAKAGHGSLLVDLPDHGHSQWTDNFSYETYAAIITQALVERLGDTRMILVGHSLGGKVAMVMALRHPELLDGLVVVDMAPGLTRPVATFAPLLATMAAIDLGALHSREEADQALRARVPDKDTRLFLLQNLHAVPHWHWQANLALLARSLHAIAGWPPAPGRYDGPVLWLLGANSEFASNRDIPAMYALFPHTRREVIEGAGHWVHADQPQAVIDALTDFSARL